MSNWTREDIRAVLWSLVAFVAISAAVLLLVAAVIVLIFLVNGWVPRGQ